MSRIERIERVFKIYFGIQNIEGRKHFELVDFVQLNPTVKVKLRRIFDPTHPYLLSENLPFVPCKKSLKTIKQLVCIDLTFF